MPPTHLSQNNYNTIGLNDDLNGLIRYKTTSIFNFCVSLQNFYRKSYKRKITEKFKNIILCEHETKPNKLINIINKNDKIYNSVDPTENLSRVKFDDFKTLANNDDIGAEVEKLESVAIKGVPNSNLLPTFNFKSLTVGFDCEYVNLSERKNKILTTQVWLSELDLGFVFVHQNNQTTDPAELIELTYQFLNLNAKSVTIVSHFGAAEYSHFSNRFKNKYKQKITVLRKCPVTIDYPLSLGIKNVSPSDRNTFKIKVKIRDTMLLYNKGLEKVGQLLKMSKYPISQEHINDFETFLKNNETEAVGYAINDAFLTVYSYVKFKEFAFNVFNTKDPITGSGLSIGFFKKHLNEGVFEAICYEKIIRNKKTNRSITIKNSNLDKCSMSYKGGLNQCYKVGIFENSNAHDYDLPHAYPSVMMLIKLANFCKLENVKIDENGLLIDINQLDYQSLGMAVIDFEFKPMNFYPLSVKTEKNGLVNPKKANNVCVTLVELYYCIKNGLFESYKINDILKFGKFELDDNFGEVVAELTLKRYELQEKYAKNPDENTAMLIELCKLVQNSAYGKMGQAIQNHDIPLSQLSNPALAGYITAVVRLEVFEQMNYLKTQGYTIYSVTTDGYLIDNAIKTEDLKAIEKLPITKLVLDNKRKLMKRPNLDVLTLKHKQVNGELYVFKTRGYIMRGGKVEGYDLLVSKNGVKVPYELKGDKEKEAVYTLNTVFHNHCFNVQYNFNDKNDIYEKNENLTRIRKEIYINFNPDVKNKLIFKDFKRAMACYDTVPYDSFDEYLNYQKLQDNYSKTLTIRYKNSENTELQNIAKWFSFAEKELYEYLFYIDININYPGIFYTQNLIQKELVLKMANDYKNVEIAKLLGMTSDQIKFIKADFKRGKVNLIGFKFDNDFIDKHKKHLEPILELVKKYLV